MTNQQTALLTGIDIPIESCHLILHQPTIEEISYIGTAEFYKGIQTICIQSSMYTQGNSLLEHITNFHIFMTVIQDKSATANKEAVKKVFKLTFPTYNVLFSSDRLIFSREGESPVVDDSNFEDLQKAFEIIFALSEDNGDQKAFNPANAKAKEIADKLMRGRQRVAELKGTSTADIFQQYLSIVSIGLKLDINDVKHYTVYQLMDAVERLQLYISWDLEMQARLSMFGSKSNDPPTNWMKPIHNK